jgi:hypothetical protein
MMASGCNQKTTGSNIKNNYDVRYGSKQGAASDKRCGEKLGECGG